MAITRHLHCCDERHLVLGAASTLAASALTAEEGIVDLDDAFEATVALLLEHHSHELVLDEPGRAVADAQMAMQFQGRHARLGLGQEVHAKKPDRERQLADVEDGGRRQAGLRPARAALPVRPAQALESAVLGALALGTAKAILPSRLGQRLATLLVGAEAGLELTQRHPGLELDSIHRHTHLSGLCRHPRRLPAHSVSRLSLLPDQFFLFFADAWRGRRRRSGISSDRADFQPKIEALPAIRGDAWAVPADDRGLALPRPRASSSR
jgi:hypothetical protein